MENKKEKSMFYDGTKLLSMKDINGNTPEIYMVTTNRSGGKTTYFNRMAFNRYLKDGSKFGLLYRFDYELGEVADKFFKDIGGLFFKGYQMKAVRRCRGVFYELFMFYPNEVDELDEDDNFEGHSCGYAFSLNKADAIKKYSHLLSDVDRIIFDEFQSETNSYCPNEIQKFISIHTSIARGKGQQARYVPVYMISNPVSIINPYYNEMGVSDRIREDTKFLRGDGYVLENGFIAAASEAQKSSAFNRAFAGNAYVSYSSENVYLNDNTAFIEKPRGKSKYLATIVYDGKEYALREFAELGVIYCDDHDDETFKYKIAVTTDDHNVNYVMLKKHDMFINGMRFYFEKGCFRFKNLMCKKALMKLVAYI